MNATTDKLMTAVQALREANAKLQDGTLAGVQWRDAREPALLDALRAMAAFHGVTLQEPLQVDSNGEIAVTAVHPDGPMLTRGCGKFGPRLAGWLSRHNARTGIVPTSIHADNGWCRLNHQQAEKMVTAFSDALQTA